MQTSRPLGRLARYLDRRFYPSHGDDWDADLFRARLAPHLESATSVLDFGAGRGALSQMDLRDSAGARFVAGVDVDPAVLGNPFLSEAKLLDAAGRIPYEDGRFDLVVASNVLEHLPDPTGTFREIRRVLRPGGLFLSKTPNRRHYVPLFARLTPHAFHVWVNRRRGREAHDTFPTRYLVNTPSDLRRVAQESGLTIDAMELVEGRPEYLRQFPAGYVAGLLYERVVNAFDTLRSWRVVMISTLRRPAA